MFGVRQSGEAYFEVADIYNDADVLKEAHEALEMLSDEQIAAIAANNMRKTPVFAL